MPRRVEAASPAGREPRGRYGALRPRPGLTPAAIVAAGRRLIERDGPDALTMRAVAAELGTAATSLYRHVADRDALLLAILEQVAEGLPVQVPGRTPHARLTRRLVNAHDYLGEHAWVLHVLIRGELVAENAFGFSNACLADFLAAGLDPRGALGAFDACWHLLLGELLDRHPLRQPQAPTQRQLAMAAVDPAALPALARVAAVARGRRRDDFPAIMGRLVAALLD